MLTYLFAALGGCANAVASVLQRKANADQPDADNLSWRLVVSLLHRPVWFLGILAVIAAFGFQALALGSGPLSEVEPILIIELPITLVLAAVFFQRRLHTREWTAAAAMTAGLAALLFFLSPTPGSGAGVPGPTWAVGIAINAALVGSLVVAARRNEHARRAALLGVATGSTFGLTAALIKAVTLAFGTGGIVAVFTTWQLYAMIAVGVLGLFLLQSSLEAGPLVAAQPGLTTADPVVSILWGALVFGENLRGGLYILWTVLSAAVLGWGVWRLSHSPLVTGDDDQPPSSATSGPANTDDTPRTAAHHGR